MNKSNFFSNKYAILVSSYPVQVLLVIFALLVFSMFSLSNLKLDRLNIEKTKRAKITRST
jgi:predicted RND superfamily exporter protein